MDLWSAHQIITDPSLSLYDLTRQVSGQNLMAGGLLNGIFRDKSYDVNFHIVAAYK